MVRRHERGGEQSVSFGPALSTVTGNYVAAKRKGVVNGVDYQHTGVVRFVQVRKRTFWGSGWWEGLLRAQGHLIGAEA
jgi:hypothetical protein